MGGRGGQTIERLPTGVVSFLLTDVEGSTALWDGDPANTALAIERHDALVDGIVRSYNGILLKHKGEGDSTLSVFHTARDAVAASDAVVRAIGAEPWPGGLRVAVRAAVHTGEAIERDGDYFGPTLNRAARVRSLARGGQILLTRATAEAVVDQLPDGCSLLDHGRHELRGMTRVERVFELTNEVVAAGGWDPRGADDGIPTPLRATPRFVGRVDELTRLEEAWQRVRRGERRVMLITGEPGIGKTQLTAQFAQAVADEAVVLFGRCEEDLSVPYQPFIEGIRPWLASLDNVGLTDIAPLALTDAARFWPEIAGRVPSLPLPQTGDADLDRYASFQATAELLSTASRTRPVLFVIDDVQWATDTTVLLLRHLVKTEAAARVLFVCTARDSEIDAPHPFAAALAGFRTAGAVDVIALAGLNRLEIEEYVAAEQEPATLADRLEAETAGNPFFISELLASPGIPAGVRDVVALRLRRLPAATQDLLSVAAILGPECDFDDLAACADDSVRGNALTALEEALSADVLLDRGRRIAFKHALVRRCVLDSLSSIRRAHLHERVGEAIAQRSDADARAGELARHFAAAGTQPARAARYAYATAAQCLSVAAISDARSNLDLAQQQLSLTNEFDAELRIDIDIAEGYTYRAEDSGGGRPFALRAVRDATAIGDFDRAAEAALLLVEAMGIAGSDPEVIAAISNAAAVVDAPPGARSQLLSALSQALEREGDHRRAKEMSGEALALARASGSDEALYFALYGAWAVALCEDSLDERTALVDELRAIADRTGAARLLSAAVFFRGMDAIEGGDRASFEASSEALHASGDASNWMHDITVRSYPWRQAFLALLDGRWDDAAALSDQMILDAGDDAHPDLLAAYAGQVLQRGRELGQHEQFLPLLEQAIADDPNLVAYRAGLATMTAEMGDLERAAEALTDVMVDGVDAVRHDQERGATLAMLAEACAALGDADVARELLRGLRPFHGRLIVIHSAVAILGATDRYNAMLLHVLGDLDGALAAFERAVALETSVGGRPLVARTQLWMARLLRDRHEPERARAVASQALAAADELRMERLAAELRAVIGSLE